MKRACLTCGQPSNQARCPTHRGTGAGIGTGTRNPDRDLNAHKRFARKVKQRDGYMCVRCGSTTDLRACHITPLHQGGSYDPANGITLCKTHDKQTDPYAT
jgi:5-methylcytosine-specific restriction endonuclease McrA